MPELGTTAIVMMMTKILSQIAACASHPTFFRVRTWPRSIPRSKRLINVQKIFDELKKETALTSHRPNKAEEDETDVGLPGTRDDLFQTQTVANNDDSNVEQKLRRLKEIDKMSRIRPKNTVSDIPISAQRIPIRIESKEHSP